LNITSSTAAEHAMRDRSIYIVQDIWY
jgi:hypothetical protein